jgi:hypothetical protein
LHGCVEAFVIGSRRQAPTRKRHNVCWQVGITPGTMLGNQGQPWNSNASSMAVEAPCLTQEAGMRAPSMSMGRSIGVFSPDE